MKRALIAASVVLVVATGCRLLPAGASVAPSASPAEEAMSGPAAVSPSQATVLGEAPEACGFPAGTALEYAGRSTTAELDVREVVGDPMSDDLADIYITRDTFPQGELNGRLVCAIFVDTPGFVEVTVHPEDGGRFVPPTPDASTTPPPGGLSEDDAIGVARTHFEDHDDWELTIIGPGPIGQVAPHVFESDYYEWAQDLAADRWVWRIHFLRADQAVEVFIDYLDGSVLGTVEYTVN
jgi:hypothetical protein